MKKTFMIFASPDYMPRAKVACDSVYTHHPESLIILRKVESENKATTYVEGLARKRLEAVRTYLLSYPDEAVILMGADCVLYAPLPEQYERLLETNDVVLVPHVINPPSANGRQLYRTGQANADFIGFRHKSIPIIDWLLEQPLVDASKDGEFYEQTWISVLPFVADRIGICRHPGLNYAYFNVSERQLGICQECDEWLIDGQPLVMAQFSGIDLTMPWRLSRHYDFSVTPPTNAIVLFSEYAEAVKAKT